MTPAGPNWGRRPGAANPVRKQPPVAAGEAGRFADRRDAGRRLAARLGHLRGEHPVIVAIPRGGVPVAAEVARALEAPLDIIVVRKVGAPQNPEYGIGALADDGVRVVDEAAVRDLGLGADELDAIVARARAELSERQLRYRAGRAPLSVHGRTAVLIDDGLATGRSAQAAARSLRERGARRVILAVPVAAPASMREMRELVDDLVCIEAPPEMWAIGLWYEDFSPTSDEEVAALLGERAGDASAEITIEVAPGLSLRGRLDTPANLRPRGVIAFAHGSGSSAASPRNLAVAATLREAAFATLLFDLLSPEEGRDREKVFDVELLATRLLVATRWLRRQPDTARLALGYFGASTGSAAALVAAAQLRTGVCAVVSRGGRPDLAEAHLHDVVAPVLLIVGEADTQVLELNRRAQARLQCESELAIIPRATHLFEEPGALEEVARLATRWFELHLGERPERHGGHAAVA